MPELTKHRDLELTKVIVQVGCPSFDAKWLPGNMLISIKMYTGVGSGRDCSIMSKYCNENPC
jgi:hypothetical protein